MADKPLNRAFGDPLPPAPPPSTAGTGPAKSQSPSRDPNAETTQPIARAPGDPKEQT